MSFNKKIGLGMALAAIAFLVSIAISFYTYRFLWINADRESFAAWLAVFEFSQFLLLLDLGFTHSFIKRHVNSGGKSIEADLPQLRGALLGVALIAAVIVLACAVLVGRAAGLAVIAYLFLALSIGFSLVGYADTAAMRLGNRFNEIYCINIFSSLVFMGILMSGFVDDVVQRLSFATFIRAAVQFFLQNMLLGKGLAFEKPNFSSGSMEVVALNASYFLFFMLDAFIMAALGVPLMVVASVLVLKKYYDALRGLWDSTLAVASVAFAKFNDGLRDWIIRAGIIFSYVGAWALSGLMLEIWLGEAGIDLYLSAGICVSAMSLSLYRMDSTRLYFQGAFGLFLPVVAALAIKGLFASLLFLSFFDVWKVYLLQGLMILCALAGIRFHAERKSLPTVASD